LLLVGCHFIPGEEIFNNTPDDLVVTTATLVESNIVYNTITVPSGRAALVGVPIRFEIRRANSTNYYDTKRIQYEFYRSIGLNKRQARLQIESDNLVYLVLPGSTAPAKTFPPQPPGYPLTPKGER